MRGGARTLCALAALLPAVVAVPAAGQTPLGYVTARGSTVTPAYEGWYPNPDGTVTLSWGFYNRNSEEVLEIPFGPDNFMEPAEFDGLQPTSFTPSREWGAFGVIVPGDYDGPRVTWTLRIRGKTFAIPANLTADWKIDARVGDADGNLPPELAFSGSGPWFVAPGGEYHEVEAEASEPIELTVWARDDGRAAGLAAGFGGRQTPTVSLTWFKHSGPGDVAFAEESAQVPAEGGSMSAAATFSEPGEYIIRARANDLSGVSAAGHAQCCWTNAFFKVTVHAGPGGPERSAS